MGESGKKLHVCCVGVALGLVVGLYVFVTGLLAMTGHGVEFVTLLSSIYLGYAPTFWGSVLGFLWGFLDGFIFGVLFAFFYNWISCMCGCRCEGSGEKK